MVACRPTAAPRVWMGISAIGGDMIAEAPFSLLLHQLPALGVSLHVFDDPPVIGFPLLAEGAGVRGLLSPLLLLLSPLLLLQQHFGHEELDFDRV